MHYFIYPKQDVSIYSQWPTYNYGLDEILEIEKVEMSTGTTYLARTLIQFDLTNFSAAALSASYFYLNLYAANPVDLNADYQIDAFPISSSWTNGTGFPAKSTISQDGATWTMKTGALMWVASGSDYITGSVSASQVFAYNNPDIRMDVTNIVRAWASSSIPNNGFLVKLTTSQENDTSSYGELTFYSMDTHTVNLPTLEAVWDDSVYITGSTQFIASGSIQGTLSSGGTIIATSLTGSELLSGNFSGSITSSLSGSFIDTASLIGNFTGSITSFSAQSTGTTTISGSFTNYLAGVSFEPVTTDQINLVFKNLKKEYKYQTNARFRIAGKDLYQRKTFLNTAATAFSIIKYLPMNNTFYSIVDAYTGRVIIPFDNFAKVSCDLNGNYFDINLNGFMPERFYRVIFKVTFNGVDSYYDNNYIFKVTK